MFIRLLTLSLAILIVLSPLVLSHNQYDETGWYEAGKYVAEFLNYTKAPCDEFYEHVCGSFSPNSIKGYESNWNDHMEDLRVIILQAIKDINPNANLIDPSEQFVRVFFDQCTSGGSDDIDHKKLLQSVIMHKIDGIFSLETGPHVLDALKILTGVEFDPWRFLARVKRDTGAEYGFRIVTDWMKLRKGSSLALIPILAEIENATEVELTTDIVRVPCHELHTLIPSIHWDSYFEELLPIDLKEKYLSNHSILMIDVFYPELLEELGREISGMNISVIKSQVQKAVADLILEQYSNFPVRAMAKEKRCVFAAVNHLSPAIAKLYFKKIGADIQEWRQDIINLARNLFSAFRFLLNNVDWLDPNDKENVQRKLDDIFFHPGIPDWIDDEARILQEMYLYIYDPNVTIFENEFQFQKVALEEQLRKISELSKEQQAPLFKMNAFYGQQNAIFVMLGLSTPPSYHVNYPLAVKYGGLGYIIGHELMHAFDSHNLYFGPHHEREWLKDSVWPEFEKRTSCLVRQYSKSCFPTRSTCVNGRNTVGENIADIDGLKVAYTAYKFSTQVFGDDPPIPELLAYTQDQLFFLTTARTWCSKGFLEKWLHDVHTPDKPRVDVMMKNVPTFARAFRCVMGSEYAPLKICSVWGDLSNPTRKHKKK